MRKAISSLVLVVLLAALAGIVYSRGFGLRLGASPAALNGPYATEEAWVVNEIVRDIAEMSSYPQPAAAPNVENAAAGTYRVVVRQTTADLDLRDEIWSPTAFAAVARVAFDRPASTSASTFEPVALGLLEFSAAAVVRAGDAASRALATNMRDARAHEAAALTLGAFALRETAGRFSDTRWALNRMTAHLAIASSLASEPGIDGRIAAAVLLTLVNRQTRALAALDGLEHLNPTSETSAWIRALRMRITQDWRTVRTPQRDSELERREYFRARRAAVGSSVARKELDRMNVKPGLEWLRLVESSTVAIEDGWVIAQALELERAEYAAIYRRTHDREIDRDPTDALSARATRCIGPDGPRVVPWGAWAEFTGRHLSLFMDKSDRYYRHTMGGTETADGHKRQLEAEFGRLSWFPLTTIFWTAGPRGSEADLRLINQAISALVESPSRVAAVTWSFLELGSHYEPVVRGVPKPAAWFMPASTRVMQNAASRLKDTGHPHGPDVSGPLLKEAPYDYGIADDYLTMRYGKKAPYAEARAAYGRRVEYDVRVIRALYTPAATAEARVALLKSGCEITAAECIALADQLVSTNEEAAAAAAYERAFADESVDVVMFANSSWWLADYYRRTKRTDDALAIAQRAAGTGSARGLMTLARISEHLGRYDAAKEAYESIAQGYEDFAPLVGFYYRAIEVRKDPRDQERWKTVLHEVFPGGLLPVSTATTKPEHGAVMMSDSDISRSAGLLSGDIIVGVDGLRVDNYKQYRAVAGFKDSEPLALTFWRGDRLQNLTVKAPNRSLDVQFRTYPVQGWGEP